MGGIGVPELVIVVAILAMLVIPLVCVIDAARRPSEQWEAVGQSKSVWVVILVVSIFVGPLGLIGGTAYLVSVRPKLNRSR